MTGAACQLGELTTLETNKVASDISTGSAVAEALQVSPFDALQLVERGREFDVNRLLFEKSKKDQADEQLEKQSDSVATYNRHQTRSGSSDSGQLSLLSSFGSLSLAGFQFNSTANQQQQNTNPFSDSTSRQSMSVDIDQHQFYCSLMLLNSLDISQYEHNKSCNNKDNSIREEKQQHQASLSSKAPSLTLSQAELNPNSKSTLDHNQHKRSLQDCHSHWFSWDRKNRESNSTGDVKTAAAIKDHNKKRFVTESDQSAGKSKKRGFGLGILGGGWQSQGATKLVAAAAAATNSSTLVDKLLTHMINKRTGNANDRSTGSMSSVKQQNSNKSASKQQQEMTMNKTRDESNDKRRADCGCTKSTNPVGLNDDEQSKKPRATQSTGGIHLLSDLSRRLARRCGVKTKAVQFGDGVGRHGIPVPSGISHGVQATNASAGGANNFKKNDNCCDKKSLEKAQQQRQLSEQATCKLTLTKEPSAFHEQSWQHTRTSETNTTSGVKTSDPKSINSVSNEAQQQQQQQQQQPQKFHPTRLIGQIQPTNQERDSTPAAGGNETNSLNQININTNYGSNGNFMCSRNNLNASISTLNTTPGNCCYWDNETCSSSGFVSSSTTGLAGRSGGGCVGSGSISFGCAGGIGGGLSGGNCGDSTATTHSCNSSAYNEPIVTPPSPPPPNSSCCSSCAEMCSRAFEGNSRACDIASLKSLDHDRQSICQHHFSLGFEEQLKLQDRAKQQDHQNQSIGAGMDTAAVDSAELDQPPLEGKSMTVARQASAPLVTTNDIGHVSGNGFGRVTADIRVTAAEDEVSREDQQENRSQEVMRNNSDESGASGGKNSKSTHLKPKTSLLTRARNSTINLASLATVTNRLSSASVGNLWHGAGSHHQHHTNLAGDSSEGGIQPLDYVTRGPFDTYNESESQHLSPTANADQKSRKSASSNKLLSVASCGSTRKVSTKEKCKRQKDAERVEKLRLLVNYLKSGSSQPVVSPVALEADEIELAERYKMHVILRDDILQDIQAGEVNRQQQQQPLDPSIQGQNKSLNAEHKPNQANALKTKSNSLINHSIGGTSASSPASSLSTSSVNQVHRSVHDGRSIPQIGNVTWVLRHSISDPGNNFEHLPTFSTTSSSSPLTKDQKHLNHLYHNHHHNQDHHNQLHPSHSRHDDHHSSKEQQQQQQQEKHDDKSQLQPNQEQVAQYSDNTSSCAPSSSYSGSSLSNYCQASGKNGSAATQQQQFLNPNQQSPKMFYIDDMDMIPVSPSSCLLNVASSSVATPQLAPPSMSHQQTSTPLTTANSTNCCSQPSTPLIYTNLTTSNIVNNNNNNNIVNIDSSEGACETESQSSSNRNITTGCAWTNPQNLATWIDNEVNSLVHDLEAKSQQLQSKHSKSGKKKWLSVTSSHSSRRSSSGAQST